MNSPLNQEDAARLRAARQQAQSGTTTVLDELSRDLGIERATELLRSCGVESVLEGPNELENLEVSISLTAQLPAIKVRLRDGRQGWLMADPLDDAAFRKLSRNVREFLEPFAAFSAALREFAAAEPVGSGVREALPEPAPVAPNTTAEAAFVGSAVEFVGRAVATALAEGASDVHFECDRQGISAKLRLDGVMSPLFRQEGVQRAEEVISRIKVLAQLDITERRLPQDGRFRHEVSGRGVDLRVSIMPSVFGEDAVLRLLDKSHLKSTQNAITLEGLGFVGSKADDLRLLAHQPNGMVLVTGPTGSGKTTTVYAALSEINTGLEKIITIEDPVEYELPGVLQIPVNERKGLTFAVGLRSILRHDPDRILVGEIRDSETAEIAVQSALTGHLVFTTVHANSLFDVVGRFRHFGIDMFGFVSALNGVVVQRLLRRLCPACKSSRSLKPNEEAWFAAHAGEAPRSLLAAVGCSECHGSGYRGRFVVAEVHTLTDGFRDLIVGQADVTELKRHAFDHGRVQVLLQAALEHVQAGETSLEEVFRVVGRN
ncbi:GspE/PulE family protein [Roseateles sp.]|uniref:GspE/PulE family protein n=1 Tax=Roseateles sp. TaxID=1971397 RepID=UPI0039EBD0A4